MTAKDISRIIPAIQAAGLVGHNLKTINKKKKTTKDMIGLGVGNIVGVSLIRATAQQIELLD